MRTALQQGNKPQALEKVNDALDVRKPDEYPKKLKGNNALLLLERAMVKQGLNDIKSSTEDFKVADKHLELLDLRNDTMGNIGKFIFSDDATVYKAPAYEKLLVNTFNLLNYLALGDIEGARVEARRLRVMQDYLSEEESEQHALLGLGSYLAGFTCPTSHESCSAFAQWQGAARARRSPDYFEPPDCHISAIQTKISETRICVNAAVSQPGPSEHVHPVRCGRSRCCRDSVLQRLERRCVLAHSASLGRCRAD